jgi:hypothetical protein
MKNQMVWTQILFLTFGTFANAQQKLNVENTTDESVIMEYWPRNDRTSKTRELFKPNERRAIEIKGQDPFFVTHRLQNEKTIEWKVYAKRDVYLNELARRQIEWELDFTFHANNQGNSIQVMSATLLTSNGDEIKLFDQPNNDNTSNFVRRIISKSWNTVRNAPDGEVDDVKVDFRKGKMSFTSDRFIGEFGQMCICEEDGACHIIGRWRVKNGRGGDLYFSVSKQSPDKMTGYCTLDGDKVVGGSLPQYPWKSR